MRVSTALLVLFSLTALPVLASGIAVELRPEASISGSVYRVDDIAKVESDNPSVTGRLGGMEIGMTPRPGRSERITQQQVMRFIEANAPEWRGKLQMSGSRTTIVRATGVMVDKQRLQQLAMEFLRSVMGQGYERIEVKPVGEMRDMMLPPDAEFRPRALSGPISRRTAVWIDIQAAGRPYAAVPVWFSVHAWKPVPIARRELPAGSEVRPEDFALETCDVMQQTAILDRLPEGTRLRMTIARGSPVAASALEPVPVISRNQEVAVRVTAGNIVVETAGVAQADGRIGEMVKIKNTGSSETFLAKVLEPGVVAVNAR